MLPRPPRSTLFPYTTLFRSVSFDPARFMPESKWRLLSYDLASPNAGAGKIEAVWEPKLEQAARKQDLDTKDGLRLNFTDTNRADRKSTRLNSSHGYISYAVF